MADMKRRIARAVAVITVALAAGHLVQSMATPKQVAVDQESLKTDTLAPETLATNTSQPIDLTQSTVVPLAAGAADAASPQAAMPAPLPTEGPTAQPAVNLTDTSVPDSSTTPESPGSGDALAADDCSVTFDSFGDQAAMISLSLLAPCHPNERVVVRHGGLAISEMTTAAGGLFLSLPALEKSAKVEIRFADGSSAVTIAEIPEMASVRRFGVQWQADDAFQIHAFENGANYGDTGDVNADNMQTPAPGVPTIGGFLTVLGDPTTANPLMAQIYTYPSEARDSAKVVVEASVTAKTCGRELIGETLSSVGGTTKITDLTLSMPDCDGIGDYLVLNNLAPDLKITAEN